MKFAILTFIAATLLSSTVSAMASCTESNCGEYNKWSSCYKWCKNTNNLKRNNLLGKLNPIRRRAEDDAALVEYAVRFGF
ncbi:Uu.00g110860.m01.CDS01 [Anthostomella pinea]|uniref:Uu.00g110860.m01.CDS01 n=1 Tax=Anthostomella pinea TaxID=933095 RepID=A0AAI8VF01_9PEZI|nr:Uu.00g110860.m01.CDS01 [Anthostomella pinea]